ncbi:MAG: hypothetical protein JNG90_04800 [Planctomycetaceae bacterium]|nr:hypothetical protein [Planctomycetaceae bacterium]
MTGNANHARIAERTRLARIETRVVVVLPQLSLIRVPVRMIAAGMGVLQDGGFEAHQQHDHGQQQARSASANSPHCTKSASAEAHGSRSRSRGKSTADSTVSNPRCRYFKYISRHGDAQDAIAATGDCAQSYF